MLTSQGFSTDWYLWRTPTNARIEKARARRNKNLDRAGFFARTWGRASIFVAPPSNHLISKEESCARGFCTPLSVLRTAFKTLRREHGYGSLKGLKLTRRHKGSWGICRYRRRHQVQPMQSQSGKALHRSSAHTFPISQFGLICPTGWLAQPFGA